jgi:hypothetical protein
MSNFPVGHVAEDGDVVIGVLCKSLKSNMLTTCISMPRASNRKRARKRARQEKEQN